MKKTPLDQLTILFQFLSGSDLTAAITGDMYLLKRPVGSGLEDIVINSLPVTSDQIQVGTANVNIYVPDQQVSIGGQSQLLPNTARLSELAELAVSLLDEFYSQQYVFSLSNQTVIEEPETRQHYLNLRIEFRFFPTP